MWSGEFETDRHLREFFPDYAYRGRFLDVGAGHPEDISNSLHFRRHGWEVLSVEPNPALAAAHRERGYLVHECAAGIKDVDGASFYISDQSDGMAYSALAIRYLNDAVKYRQIAVSVRRLDGLLEGVDALDIVSVDTEGWELEALGGLDVERLRP